MRWGLALVLLGIAIVIAMRCRSDQSRPRRAQPTASTARVMRVDPKVRAAIEGTVSDGTAPLAGAVVCADGEDDDELPCVLTDVRGAFAIRGLRPGRYTVVASLASFQPKRSHAIELSTKTENVTLELVRGGMEITGTVFDLGGGAIARARVSTSDAITETRDDGTFALWVASSRAFVSASAEGYASTSDEVDVPGRIELFLIPEAIVSGTVVDANTGEPIEGARVDIAGSERRLKAVATTDEHGAFRASRLHSGRYRLSARTEHGYGLAARSVLVGVGAHVSGVVVQLHPAALVTAKVTLSSTKQPCAKPHVSLRDVGKDRNVSMSARGNGVLIAEGVLPGTYAVDVSCQGALSRVSYPPLVVTRSDVTMELAVDPGATITGRVRSRSGTPMEDVVVYISEDPARDEQWRPPYFPVTNRDGRYAISGLPAGTFTIQTRASEASDYENTQKIVLAAGETVERDFVVNDPGALQGSVVDRDGKSLAGIVVAIDHGDDDTSDVFRTTDVNGRFAMTRVQAGDYFVTARRSFEYESKPLRQRVTIRAGQTEIVTLVVDDETGSITGSVMDTDGKPAADAFVTVTKSEWGSYASDSTGPRPIMTAADGTFTAANLPLGATYNVRAFRKGGGDGIAAKVPVGGTAKIQLRKLGSIAGTVRSWSASLDDLQVSINQRTEYFFRTNGAFVIEDVPAGHHTLVVGSEGKEASVEIDLAEGEHKSGVEIELTSLVTVTGRAVDRATGKPVAKAFVNAMPPAGRTGFALAYDRNDRGWVTDEGGRFTIKRVPLGPMLFATRADGYQEIYNARTIAGTNIVDVGDLPLFPVTLSARGESGLDVEDVGDSRNAKLVVSNVAPGGPAALAGIAVGDVITSIDGVSMSGYGTMNIYGVLFAAAPGTTHSIALARGITVEIVLAKQR